MEDETKLGITVIVCITIIALVGIACITAYNFALIPAPTTQPSK